MRLETAVVLGILVTAAQLAGAALPVATGIQPPLMFEQNEGQTSSRFDFIARGPGYLIQLDSAGMALRGPSWHVSARFLGGGSGAPGHGVQSLAARVRYYSGADAAAWRSGIPVFEKVVYRDVYPGIDVVYYGHQGRLEYDLVVSPGADPRRIRIAVEGAGELTSIEDGGVSLQAGDDELRWIPPRIYQEYGGVRKEIRGKFVLSHDGVIGFEIGGYDPARALVIDPELVYSTYFGGAKNDCPYSIAVDGSGFAYITGETWSVDLPRKNEIQSSPKGERDVFVAKLSTDGSTLVYATYLGGAGYDSARAIAVDSLGNAYLTGTTRSQDFPVTTGAYRTSAAGQADVFVTKLNTTGGLLYSTYAGGSGDDMATSIAADSSGNVFVSGYTSSVNFPAVSAAQSVFHGGFNDAFAFKLAAGGASLLYSTYLGGSGTDAAQGIALTATGKAFVVGSTDSVDFPTSNPIQAKNDGGYDAFVVELGAAGTLQFGTYLGGALPDFGNGIAVDSSGAVYVTGSSLSSDFPTTEGALQNSKTGYYAAFVTKFRPGTGLVYAARLGGGNSQEANAIAVDESGQAYIAGYTYSTDFPVKTAVQSSLGGSSDAFVAGLDKSGASLIFSTYLGGAADDRAAAMALDKSGALYVAGFTLSGDFPISAGVVGPSLAGGVDGFIAKVPASLTAATGATAKAVFLGTDDATQGSWKTRYGADGSAVSNDLISYPSYAKVSFARGGPYVWQTSTPDVRALQKASGADRIASLWFSWSSLSIDIDLTDGNTHQVALYFLDWDSGGRKEKIDVLDAGTGAVLDSQSISGFSGGRYLLWNLSGHVTFRIALLGGSNAVVNGLFFGGTPAPAVFLGTDDATRGSWKGVYGTDGLAIYGDAVQYPAYAQVSFSGQIPYVWNGSTTDLRALQKASGADRIASLWFSRSSFTIDIDLTDGNTHQIALYFLDWDSGGRKEKIDVLDAGTGAVLDSQSISGFSGGRYLRWNLSGHIRFRITLAAGSNAVVSGLFFR